MKMIYIVHEYGIESHFKALYDCAEQYGYKVSGQIILSKIEILRHLKSDFNKKDFLKGIARFIVNVINHFRIYFLKNEIMIVGIAPYDYLLNKYHRCFEKNHCYYFTSQTNWTGNECVRGNISNRDYFENAIGEFLGAFCVTKKCEDAVNKYNANTSVVYHAIDYEAYKKRIEYTSTDVKKYVYMGVFNDNKNIPLILRWIKNNKYDIEFDFMGTGKYDAEITELSLKDSRVRNLGYCGKEVIKNTLCKYDFLVLPSNVERFGIVLVEALASGVPCIVSDSDGPLEVIKNNYNGLIFELNDKEKSFFQVMDRSYNMEEEEHKLLAENGLKTAMAFDSRNIVKRWLALIEDKGE